MTLYGRAHCCTLPVIGARGELIDIIPAPAEAPLELLLFAEQKPRLRSGEMAMLSRLRFSLVLAVQ